MGAMEFNGVETGVRGKYYRRYNNVNNNGGNNHNNNHCW